MAIIDIHSHILPGIDDGSRNLDESIKMLEMSRNQGVELIYATPHFYADQDHPDDFLRKREEACKSLFQELRGKNTENTGNAAASPEKFPEIRLGAEVAFFPGMSYAKALGELTLETKSHQKLLLLEMPFGNWNEDIMQELWKLRERRDFRLVLAHLERFTTFKKNHEYIKKLLKGPDLIQVNAGSILEGFGWYKFGKWFRDDWVDFLGSDCHGIEHRAPNIEEARRLLDKKLGPSYLKMLDAHGERMLDGEKDYAR